MLIQSGTVPVYAPGIITWLLRSITSYLLALLNESSQIKLDTEVAAIDD